MKNRWAIGCLDVYSDDVFAVIEKAAPETFVLRRAMSYESAEQERIAQNADFLLTGWAPVPKELIVNNPNLKMIQKFGVGFDKIDLVAAASKGVPVAICSGLNANPVAELALGLMIGVLRHMWYAISELRNGAFRKAELRANSYQLSDKTVGFVGMGNVGRALVRHLQSFNCLMLYFDIQRLSGEEEKEMGLRFTSIEELLATSDIVTLHVPLTPDTCRFINRERIALLKPTAIVINTARGELVDEDALADALEDNRVLGAGLDVMECEPPDRFSRLLRHPRVLVTPHVGGSVIDNVENVAVHCFENIRRVMNGEPLPERDFVNRHLIEGEIK